MYQYEYPHPAVTTDAVVFTVYDDSLHVLLIQRAREPFMGMWALPGGFVDIAEGLDACAYRELQEETGLDGVVLHQFRAFGEPDRDPRERIITVAYMGLLRFDQAQLHAGDDAANVNWFAVSELPELTADHQAIIAEARDVLIERIETSEIAFDLLPERFSLDELRRLYEVLFGDTLDSDNFRNWVLAKGWIEPELSADAGA